MNLREKRTEYMRNWYRSLPIEVKQAKLEKRREQYKNSPEEYKRKISERAHLWEKEHRHLVRIRNKKPSYRFVRAKLTAKRRNLEWNIPFSDFNDLISRRCHYCDGSICVSGTGLDRMDNLRGYIVGNVVPCCMRCNLVKNSILTYEEMMVAMKAIKELRLSKVVPIG